MALPSTTSLAYSLILRARPSLAYDLNELPEWARETGTVDQIAVELEVQGSGTSASIQTEALVRYGREIVAQREAWDYVIDRTAQIDPWLMAWCVIVTSRDVADYFPEEDLRLDNAFKFYERTFVAGPDRNDLAAAIEEASQAAIDAYDSYDAVTVSAAEAAVYVGRMISDLLAGNTDEAVGAARRAHARVVDAYMSAARLYSGPDGTEEDYIRGLALAFAEALPSMPVRAT